MSRSAHPAGPRHADVLPEGHYSGPPTDLIALHGNNKSDAEIARAIEAGVGRIVLDSFQEIVKVAHIAESLGRRQPVQIRVTVGVEAHTHEFIATAHEDQKFGLALADGM